MHGDVRQSAIYMRLILQGPEVPLLEGRPVQLPQASPLLQQRTDRIDDWR